MHYSGKGVHVVTVNDYLAKRDSEWMGKIYNFLGLSVGYIYSGMPETERKKHMKVTSHMEQIMSLALII